MISKKINIGIIQGRLTKTQKNILQKFPTNWAKEFYTASKLGYKYIEFFSERKLNSNNPIWSKSSLLNIVFSKNNLKIYSFVDDFIINNNFSKVETLKYCKKLIKQLFLLRIKFLILPFYEKSKITKNNYQNYLPNLKKICDFAKFYKIKILIESNLSPELYFKIKKTGNLKNFNIVIDTGNRINIKRNLYNDVLSLKKEIKLIHIKDKNKNLENVILGNGKVNFLKFFKSLKKIKYDGNLTVECTRGDDYLKTAKKKYYFYKKLFKKNLFYLKNLINFFLFLIKSSTTIKSNLLSISELKSFVTHPATLLPCRLFLKIF